MIFQSQMTQLLEDIEPSVTTNAASRSAHISVRDYIAGHTDYKHLHVKSILSGSYARDTAIRPRTLNGIETRPDVDIIVVTEHTLADSPRAVLSLLQKVLEAKYEIKKPYNHRSVGIVTAAVDMDVVPIIAPQGMTGTLYIPDRTVEKWIVTNPPGHTAWATEVNKAMGNRFKPLVKLAKWWRRENETSTHRPKGFVIECLIAEAMSATEAQYGPLFVTTLETIVHIYRPYVAAGLTPCIADPSVSGNDVCSNIRPDEFASFWKKAEEHAVIGRLALEERDVERSLELWRKIFGRRFPASSTRSLLSGASTPPVLAFPDRPIMPKKPDGFA